MKPKVNKALLLRWRSGLLPGTTVAVTVLTGASFSRSGSFRSFGEHVPAYLLALIVLSLLFSVLFQGFYDLLDRTWRKAPRLGNCAMTRYTWPLMLAGWLPYLVAFYPGSMEWDMIVQINTYYGFYLNTNHHPYLSTRLMGALFECGRTLGSDSVGIFLYILLQTCVLSGAFSRTLNGFLKLGISRGGYVAGLLFFTVLPLWGFVAQFGVKDVLYTGVVVLFSLNLWLVLLEGKRISGQRALELALWGILVCLLRNNGALVVFPALAVLFFTLRGRQKKRCLAVLLSIFSAFLVWLSVFLPLMQVRPAEKMEGLSVPLQQIARCVSEHREELSEEERQYIRTVFGSTDPGTVYDPERSDAVKQSVRNSLKPEEIQALWRLWTRMLVRYPVTCLEAFVANTVAYVDPFSEPGILPLCEFNRVSDPVRWYDFVAIDAPRPEETEPLRLFLGRFYDLIGGIPVIRLLFSRGAYTVLLLLLTVWVIQRKQKGLLAGMMPSLMSVCCCLFSPVNGMLRYFLPVIAMMPAILYAIRIGMDHSRKETDECVI